ncbi:DNA cytosine methyltransferase [Chromobacterium haemolyticum]|uniref:DNA cytosine methyltransferase n=1 Tax=Chromobacterium haemolyticum TaxID=394935 RepID=UPI0024468A80|nr:DNA cytosine methyltransferase [Chromobacterium haemolyticum]MDH0342088.1 DNA cytosine methyltransferase [Chromobacterium haemolyticum]
MMEIREIRHGHLCSGLGGGAKGFSQAQVRVGNLQAKFRCLGGIDVDEAAIRDFNKLAGVPGTVMDLFDRAQYIDFHGKEPPANWHEATPTDIVRAMGGERPHIWFISAPCKGLSGLMSEEKSKTKKYQALNRLTLRAVWLALEAFRDDPVELFVFENVPRIATRGRHLVDQICSLFRAYGYAVAETTHDCGEIGNLAQSRKRFLLVARHIEKVPPFLYEPEKHRLESVGTVLGRMPMPGNLAGGPMHRVPSLQWKTWVRLAFVEAGGDWRSLNKLAVEDGHLRDYLLVPEEYRSGYLGVNRWEDSTGVIAGRNSPTNGAFSVADPRPPAGALDYQQYGVMAMHDTSGAVINVKSPGQGTFSVADPRLPDERHANVFRIVPFSHSAGTVTGDFRPSSGGGVADPRPRWKRHSNNLSVVDWENYSPTVIAGGKGVQGGWLSIADPRTALNRRERGDHYLTGGHYGVVGWDQSSGAVSAAAGHDNGRWSVADIRIPEPNDKLQCVIRALDGTWHRPFTTLELAALQSLIDPEEYLELDGLSDSAWRERIGNAVPPAAARAIAEVMGTTLLLAWSGETFVLSATPIWVRPVAMALSVQGAA